jgi:uncharacterized protein with FMN-binding domain
MPPGQTPKKVANSLIAMSSAAILAVYAAGYTRTRAAARRLEAQSAARVPALIEAATTIAPPALPTAVPPPKPALRRPVVKPPVEADAAVRAAAPAPIETPEPPPVAAPPAAPSIPEPAPHPASPAWKDGTYYGWGSSRHGDIQAAVIIEGGRIASATVAQCLTRYSCSVISQLPPEVPQRQSAEVDYVSGATQSANAFYYAVVDALNKAK